MEEFKDLNIGDMFNTEPARYVKIDSEWGICVMSGMVPIGAKVFFLPESEVFVLYTTRFFEDVK